MKIRSAMWAYQSSSAVKGVTLNDLQMPVFVQICFLREFGQTFCLFFGNNYMCVNRNELLKIVLHAYGQQQYVRKAKP